MNAYTDFAGVYDTFMDETPYEEWGVFLLNMMKKYNISDGLVAELGCGTGTMTEYMAKAGYDMIGIDNSPEMLNIAMDKKAKSGLDILYLCQDMREFELYGTVRVMLSVCDCLNYVVDPEEIIDVMRLVNNYLDYDGYFIFDFNTVHKYRDIIGDTTISENREDCAFIWDNYYHEDDNINEYELTIFVKEEEDMFRRFSETHYQRGYTLEEMKSYALQAGLKFVKAYDGYTHNPVDENTQRVLMVLKKEA